MTDEAGLIDIDEVVIDVVRPAEDAERRWRSLKLHFCQRTPWGVYNADAGLTAGESPPTARTVVQAPEVKQAAGVAHDRSYGV